MTGALLTDTWNSMQKLVEGLRPLMLKVACVIWLLDLQIVADLSRVPADLQSQRR